LRSAESVVAENTFGAKPTEVNMRTALMAIVSAAALCALACATPAAAQDAAHALPNYRPGDFVQGIGVALAAPFQMVFAPTLEVLGGWPVSNCQRTQAWMGHEWRTVTVCN
jgi:hypothetical protein